MPRHKTLFVYSNIYISDIQLVRIMIEHILLIKSIHIVGAVAWFGGMFYLVRIFVYHVEALDKKDPERSILIDQFKIMESRVIRIILRPAMLITWIFGLLMIVAYIQTQGMAWLKVNSWLHTKLLLVFVLSGYSDACVRVMKKLDLEQIPFSSFKMRLFNEVPTLFLLAIVLLAVYRNSLNSLYAFGGILIFGVILYAFAKWYQSSRTT